MAARKKEAGTYDETMVRFFSGWDNLDNEEVIPWRDSDGEVIKAPLRKDAAESVMN